jgi:hypothetical protein
MAKTTQPPALPLVDDATVKDTLAETCVGASVVAGNVHITFASVTTDYTIDPSPAKRVVSCRLVMPIPGILELQEIIRQVVDALKAQGVITNTPVVPTIISPSGRPN